MQQIQIRKEIHEMVRKFYMAGEKTKFTPFDCKVPYAGRVFDEQELVNAVDASLDFWLTEGRFTKDFEAELAEYINCKNLLTVNSGSSANLIAFSALTSPKLGERRILPGDEVITVAAGFPTTVNPIIQNQAIPVFVDVEIGTYVPTVEAVSSAITSKTKAIMIAHTMGIPFDVAAISDICREKNIWLIEDCCDALGTKLNGQHVGTFGDISTLSFYPAHHITTGEGGAVFTNNDLLNRIAYSFRDWGRDCYCRGGHSNSCGKRFSQQLGDLPNGYDHKYTYSHIGYNLKMTEIQAAIGCAQLKKLESFVNARRSNWTTLSNALKSYANRLLLPKTPELSAPSYFGFVITVRQNSGFTRNELTSFLEASKIETRNLFCGNLVRQPAYSKTKYRISEDLANTDTIMNNTFFIGVYPGFNIEHLDYISETFKLFMNRYPKP